VATKPWSWVERHVAEWLGLGSFNDLKDIKAHCHVDHLELVNERDVNSTEDVLGELHGLGSVGGRDRDHAGDELLVERHGQALGGLAIAADNFGDARGLEVEVARVLALRREGEEEVGPGA
jgi:hypothetical protein